MRTMKEYPTIEVLIRGIYCKCQVLTSSTSHSLPKYIAVNSLNQHRPGEFIATIRNGAWGVVSLREFIDDLRIGRISIHDE